MKIPDKRLIFFNSLESPLDFKFTDERCEGKIRYCANRKQNQFNVDQSTQSELIGQWATPHHLSDVRRGAPS